MYCREKPLENHKPRKTHRNMPSFSSSLLDEIYRSIDENAEGPEDSEVFEEKPVSGFRAKSSSSSSIRDEEMASYLRACLVEKWMEKEVNEKFVARRRRTSLLPEFENRVFQDNDLSFFSSTSSSSDSSGALSSSDTEFSTTKSNKVSCFSKRPKPVRTGVSPRQINQQEECFLFEDYQNYQKNKVEDDLIKSKSRALKIYANLKKVKQPISPGGRLTSFINSLFTNANRKKSKDVDRNKGFQELNSPDQSTSSTCSSASSFSRSCLSKYSPKSREKMRNGIQRTVRFHPVGVIVDQDSKPCGKKSIYNEGCDKYGRPPLPPNALAELKLSLREKNRKVQDQRKGDFSMFSRIHSEEGDDDNDDDAFSESSSDLFELDHLSLSGNNNRFCEELPVYETTYFDKNRCLIR